MTDLWPKDIDKADDASETPYGILKEQASLLGKRTKNIVKAEVRQIASNDIDNLLEFEIPRQKREFAYEFNIVAPLLEFYRFRLFKIKQKVTKLYPLVLALDDPDLVKDLYPEKHGYPLEIPIKDRGSLEGELKKIFEAKSTKNLIRLLMNQSNVSNLNTEKGTKLKELSATSTGMKACKNPSK
jgi:hypothetical protein